MAASRPPPPEGRSPWIAAIVLFGVLAAVVTMTLVVAQSEDAGTEGTVPDTRASEASPDIIPGPNQGRAPEDPGDRGGWAQLATLAAVVVGIGVLVLLVWRSSRRARAAPHATTGQTRDPAA